MADIPETVYAMARAIVADNPGADILPICRAIMAERSRCRRIVGNAMVLGQCTVKPYRAIRDGAEP